MAGVGLEILSKLRNARYRDDVIAIEREITEARERGDINELREQSLMRVVNQKKQLPSRPRSNLSNGRRQQQNANSNTNSETNTEYTEETNSDASSFQITGNNSVEMPEQNPVLRRYNLFDNELPVTGNRNDQLGGRRRKVRSSRQKRSSMRNRRNRRNRRTVRRTTR